jgi:sugar-specific transcriptional regulator TrmB
MHDAHRAKLESFGLSTGEAQIYLTLLRSGGTLGASTLAKATRIPRTGVYPLLNALIQKGIARSSSRNFRNASASPQISWASWSRSSSRRLTMQRRK